MKRAGIFSGLVVLAVSLFCTKGYSFTFAGYDFDQNNTPDQAILLGNSANLNGAIFSAGFPTTRTQDIPEFPGGSGFNSGLSLARLTGLESNGTRAVNLPNGNNGTTNRHGIQVSWSGGRTLSNLLGPDFVVYESASTSSATEGVMARVLSGSTWTDWYYFAPSAFQGTSGLEGVHSYGFDLSDMGLSLNLTIDTIQIANLIDSDRIVGAAPFGEGQVLFGIGTTRPDAGDGFDSDRIFSTGQLDPDPLYIAALHNLYIPPVPEPSSALLLAGAIAGVAVWRRKSRS